jgi:hypothetical protein
MGMPLEMVETTMREPGCPNDWCRSGNGTIKWVGPAEEGALITPALEYIYHCFLVVSQKNCRRVDCSGSESLLILRRTLTYSFCNPMSCALFSI